MATAALDYRESLSARPIFVATVFVGSFLLFLMQPMVARMALPRLGGAPAVWASAMLVYQALLLGGYAYAHLIGRLAPARQGLLHIILLGTAALWLPVRLGGDVAAAASPIVWVPWLLATSIGPLFFVLSAGAPLLQRWFAMREPGADPYALYAASNLGSFGGLIAYPLAIEPLLPLGLQVGLWSAGFVLLCLLIAACVLLLPRMTGTAPAAAAGPAPALSLRLRWIALAAVPSGLILATTTHITTDIIAMPLIWVVPLGLYLLSFTFAFRGGGRVAAFATHLLPVVLATAGAAAASGVSGNLWVMIACDLAVLFTASVALHRRLYDLRPAPGRLTDFYLCMALGGVIGGLFCALLAPALFDWLYEYPLLVVAAALLATLPAGALSPVARRWLPVVAILLSLYAGGLIGDAPGALLGAAALLALLGLTLAAIRDRAAFVTCLVALTLALGGWSQLLKTAAHGGRVRSYFGIYTVGVNGSGAGRARVLIHGTTTHGIQLLDPARALVPTGYYVGGSGIGAAMRAAPALFGPRARIGVVGLGAGTLACYARPGQSWRFYEIDPAIVRIARDPGRFGFLERCRPDASIVVGDARLTLAREPDRSRDLLAIDAFSSDAVPMHLLTREATGVYGRVLVPDGLLMVHISNKYVDLAPVLAAAASAGGWQVMVRDFRPGPAALAARAAPSLWVAMSRSAGTLARLRASDRTIAWQPIERRDGMAAWTDDHASVLPLLRRPW